MVVFICNACGQSVKKNQVEKHYKTVCPQCEVLSCIDCGKDFHGEEYNSHTSCISEAEKYQGKLYKPKDKQNKGEQKQQAWIKHVQTATSSGISNPRVAKLMEKLSAYDNIPRKRSKFENFCKNSIGVRDNSLLSQLWDLFSEKPKLPDNEDGSSLQEDSNNSDKTDHNSNLQNGSRSEQDTQTPEESMDMKKKSKKKQKKSKEVIDTEEVIEQSVEVNVVDKKSKKKRRKDKETCNGELNGDVTNEKVAEKKGKKRKNVEEDIHETKKKHKRKQNKDETEVESQNNDEQQVEPSGKFNWGSIVKRILKEAEDNEMKVKKLRKKVLAEFQARGGDGRGHTDNELTALFDKKINNNPKLKVHKDRVTLKR